MRLDRPRVEPLERDAWDSEMEEVFGAAADQGRVLNIFKTLANHSKLMRRWLVFGNHVLSKSTLPARERELVILRIGWLCQAEYEWGQHVLIARDAGLSDEEIERITRGPGAPGWSAGDVLLLQATDELHGDAFISDATWKALGERWNTQELMDLVFCVGQYNLVSMALNTFGVQRDEGVPGFPGERS